MDETKELIVNDVQPKDMVEFATNAARVLKDIVTNAKTSVRIKGVEYLKFEAWQTIAKFYNSTVTVEWTKQVFDESGVINYEARANVIDKTGRIIGSAESSCSKAEKTWSTRENFQVKSMAQTRACAKALRNVYAWVVVLANYAPTPAEEMTDDPIVINEVKDSKPLINEIKLSPGMFCNKCQVPIIKKVYDYSMSKFHVPLCYDHQNELKNKLINSVAKEDDTPSSDEECI
jgi:hypothetical protein